MNKVNYILTSKTVIVNYNNETHTVDKGTVEFDQIVSCLKEKRYEDIPNIINASLRLKKYSNDTFYVKDGIVCMDGEELPSQLSDRILSFEKEGLPYEPLVKFWQRLKKNVSYRARNQLFNFLEHNGHPITDDGCFIAYKGITSEFKDCHTQTFDNSVGAVVTMPREQVDDDPNHTCSSGLHVASYNYAHNMFGGSARGVTVEVKVDPADVVAVPVDYNGEKMRVCKYEVIGISKGERTEIYSPSSLDEGDECDENCEDCFPNREEEDDYYLQEVVDDRSPSKDSKRLSHHHHHYMYDDESEDLEDSKYDGSDY